uniref:Uncharacterized protein n=1 Tax=Phlebotomus papatasi TaxID=29031 RepID=A0A1B0D3M6_PHLPP
MTCHGVPEVVIVRGKVCVDEGNLRVAEGQGSFVDTPIRPPYVYDALAGKKTEDACNGVKKLDITQNLEIEIPDHSNDQPLSSRDAFMLSGQSMSLPGESVACTPSGRAPRQEGQRNLQDTTFSISDIFQVFQTKYE